MEFYFVRHGESAHNAAGLFCGSLDSPLTDAGLGQASEAAEALAHEPLAWIVSSPLVRARDTAEVIAAGRGFEIEVDDRLVEHTKGVLEGTAYRSMRSAQWSEVEGAETMHALYERVRDLMLSLAQRDGLGAIVAHAGVARAIECLRLGADPAELYDLAKAGNAQPYRVSLHLADRPEAAPVSR